MRWIVPLCLAAGLLGAPVGAVAQNRGVGSPIALRLGLVITHSVRIVPGTYRLAAPTSLDSAAIVIRGDNITVDFSGASLEGAGAGADPDQSSGVAIRIEGGRNIGVIGARIRGYKIAIRARGTHGLTLTGNDASHNWKPRLYSVIEHESLADWLSYHNNEKNEWLRFGAGFYLERVIGGVLRGNSVEQGMNGLMLTGTDSLRIQGNTFSFNSGLGIGLYRSSDNVIVNNRLEFNVRGYSHRFYRRGQDSAALLLYEQSNRNIVAWNTATHSGDGLFLWAGQSTMDSGEGGANENVFYANDFSWAPTNAMEATFSRNTFLANRAFGSDYGLWGGYSFESKVIANCFGKNRFGIAIEHGQDNLIATNHFDQDSVAVRLWGDSLQPSDWGYPKHRDTRSRDYRIEKNVFVGNRLTVQAARTSGLTLTGNDSLGSVLTRCVTGSVPAEYASLIPKVAGMAPRIPTAPLASLDRSAMVVDEWGPFDWKSPKLWPLDSSRAVPLRLAVLGPAGGWRVVDRRGIGSVSRVSGRVGDTISVTPTGADWELALEYRGGPTVSPTGQRRGASIPYRFSLNRFEPAAEWLVKFFSAKDTTDLRKGIGSPPILERRMSRLDLQWYRPLIVELPTDRWSLQAATSVLLGAGEFTLRSISDDGIRVWVDQQLVIDRWTHHESTVDSAPLSSGRHEIKVEFFQDDGWTELRLDILKSPASPHSTVRPVP